MAKVQVSVTIQTATGEVYSDSYAGDPTLPDDSQLWEVIEHAVKYLKGYQPSFPAPQEPPETHTPAGA